MNVLKPHQKTTVATLLDAGTSQRQIGRLTGIDRKTIRAVQLRLAAERSNSPGVATGSALQTPPPWPPASPPTPPPSSSTSVSACEPHRAFIEAQLRLRRNFMAIYQDLVDQHGFTGAYNSVKRFAAALAKAAQNPIADMISVPLQLNTNFGTGPLEKTQYLLNIQPVYPILNADWNLITRTIVPVLSQPALTATQDRQFGIGDIQFSAFLSPKQPAGGWIWGAGAIAQLNTASDDRLGQGVWGLGPTAVALRITETWVYGALINNVWSVRATMDEPR